MSCIIDFIKGDYMKNSVPIKSIETINHIILELYKKENRRDVFLFLICIHTGLSISKVIKMKKADIVDCSINTKIKGKSITISLLNIKNEILAYTDELDLDEYLFLSNKADKNGNQKHISREHAYRILASARKRLNLKYPLNSSTFKKTFAYHHYLRNKDIEYIALYLGTDNINEIKNYLHINKLS
ncbi:hypothetical protein CW718_11495 [Macrococcoides caseolyticum]|nr:hypothetical protein CW718_11495 [Macrococcus caseolyticus]